jgi:hypothetical protein
VQKKKIKFFFFLLDAALGPAVVKGLQGFLRLLLCTTNDDPHNVH